MTALALLWAQPVLAEEDPERAQILQSAEAQAARAAELKRAATEVAIESNSLVQSYCADIHSADSQLGAETELIVSAQRAKVSTAYKESNEGYLLYWRGVLAQCLGIPDKAKADLEAFLLRSDALPSQVRDARRRLRAIDNNLRSLLGEPAGPPPAVPHVIVGAALGSGAALLAGLAGGQGQRWNEAHCLLTGQGSCEGVSAAAGLTYADYSEQLADSADKVNAFGVLAAGLALGGIVQAIVGAATNEAGGAVSATIQPAGTGVMVRW